ncbi:MAG: hypothetical protein GYB64_19205, partial [Chloroflexi bacterium]|nr:hypothetical protein [Chloroflexota bacterium]
TNPDSRTFPETGHTICERIREYWEQNGGLPVFGSPIEEQAEQAVETVEDQAYTVQWFRNWRELHPENDRPYDVLLGLLGNILRKENQAATVTVTVR